MTDLREPTRIAVAAGLCADPRIALCARYPERAEEIMRAGTRKLRWYLRAAKHGVTRLWTTAHYRPRVWAVDHVVNGTQNHTWYRQSKAGDGVCWPGPKTARGQIRKIRRERLYLVPGYAREPYPTPLFVALQ